MALLGVAGAAGAQQAAQTVKVAAPPADLPKDPTLYLIGYSHLDTEWRWTYPQVIREFLTNTLHQNFDLFPKYPDYTFNWTGSNRYKLMKEYYPADYAKLKQYAAQGRWFPAGSNVEEGDVDMPSEESIIRQILYGNQFFRRELGTASNEFMIPDCFGFPASLPSIFAHCGLKGFNTQKLTWGSAVGIPFNIGVWEGPDGQSVVAALNPGDYTGGIPDDLSHDQGWIDRVNANGKKSGVYTDYHYYGIGDRGGSVREADARQMEASVHGNGPLRVISATTAQMFDDITPDTARRPAALQGRPAAGPPLRRVAVVPGGDEAVEPRERTAGRRHRARLGRRRLAGRAALRPRADQRRLAPLPARPVPRPDGRDRPAAGV